MDCSRCRRLIPDGEPYWALSRTQEVLEQNIVTVLGSGVVLVVLCDTCAGRLPSVYDFLRDLPAPLPEPGGEAPPRGYPNT